MKNRMATIREILDSIDVSFDHLYHSQKSIREAILSFEPHSEIKLDAIGQSRAGHPLWGVQVGNGPSKISIIAGCHADEPVGPLTATLLPSVLRKTNWGQTLLKEFTFYIIPQMNPDGALMNKAWMSKDYELKEYLKYVKRELPGDDIEFCFPDSESIQDIRPENLVAADFLKKHGPYKAHFSLHSMGIAGGIWFLIGKNKSKQCEFLKSDLVHLCSLLEYPMLDIDRKGEKGFEYLGKGFSTSPTSVAMKKYFLEQKNQMMASKFHFSSMEYIQSLGGDPLMMVSEIPNFIVPALENLLGIKAMQTKAKFDIEKLEIQKEIHKGSCKGFDNFVSTWGIKPVPVLKQLKIQILMIYLSLKSL